MAYRAPYGGLIRFSAESLIDEAIDTQMARVLLNNAMHLDDEDGQVIAHDFPESTMTSWLETSFNAATSTDLIALRQTPDLRIRLTGTFEAYALRCRIGAWVSSGTGTAKVWIVAHAPGQALAVHAAQDEGLLYATAAASSQWLTTYAPDGTASTILRVHPVDVIRGVRTVSTVDEIGGANTAVYMPTIRLTVYVEPLTGSGIVSLVGFHVSEVRG